MSDTGRRLIRRPWLAGSLVLSLALNAFLLGAIATDFLRAERHSGSSESRALRYELRWLEGRLDPEAMKQVEGAVAAARPKTVAHLDRLRQLRSELAALSAVSQPDRPAIDTKLAAIRAEVQSMQTEAQAATIDALLALPAAARANLGRPDTER